MWQGRCERASVRCLFVWSLVTVVDWGLWLQSCISVQRIFVHEAVADKLRGLITEEAKKLKASARVSLR